MPTRTKNTQSLTIRLVVVVDVDVLVNVNVIELSAQILAKAGDFTVF
ncbi:MAG TPA: hypothetical protein VGL91_06210 [Acidobacteriota bacterium]